MPIDGNAMLTVKHLLKIYQNNESCVFSKTEVRFGLEEMTLLLLYIASPTSNKPLSMFLCSKIRFFVEIKKSNYHEINQVFFSTKYVSQVKLDDKERLCLFFISNE